MTKICFGFIWILTICLVSILGQNRDRIARAVTNNSAKDCRVFLNGKLIDNPKPIYPNEAKSAGISGKVEVVVEINEQGSVTTIESTNGNDLLAKAATEAAKQAKFSPTTCDGKATKTIGIITYNFAPVALTKNFFKPTKIEDFSDVFSENNFYEAVLYLTENYRISFGYADQKFHAEMPLTKGDFAHFLRQTLEMLDSRSKLAKKHPKEIGLYKSYNPYSLKEIEFNPTSAYAESLKILLQKYSIILTNQDGNFDDDALMTQGEIIKIWREIFNDEAVPINFLPEKDKDKEMSRGDFAIYLKESLDVLTYKVLP